MEYYNFGYTICTSSGTHLPDESKYHIPVDRISMQGYKRIQEIITGPLWLNRKMHHQAIYKNG